MVFWNATKREARTIVPRTVCGRVKFLKASCGEMPGEGRLRCSRRGLSAPALNETGTSEDDVRLHGSHGEFEIFSSRAPRQMHFFGQCLPNEGARLTAMHTTRCASASDSWSDYHRDVRRNHCDRHWIHLVKHLDRVALYGTDVSRLATKRQHFSPDFLSAQVHEEWPDGVTDTER